MRSRWPGSRQGIWERPEPDSGERGPGLYILEELIGYTIASIEVATRRMGTSASVNVADGLTEMQGRMVRSLPGCLVSLAKIELQGQREARKR